MSSDSSESDEAEVVDYVGDTDDDTDEDFEMIYHEPPSIDMKELLPGQDYRIGFHLIQFVPTSFVVNHFYKFYYEILCQCYFGIEFDKLVRGDSGCTTGKSTDSW